MSDHKPDAYLHTIVDRTDGIEDLALSFDKDSFPFDGFSQYTSIKVEPLFTRPPVAGLEVVTDELMRRMLPAALVFADQQEHLDHARNRAKEILIAALSDAAHAAMAVSSIYAYPVKSNEGELANYLQMSVMRLKDMLMGDDGQAWKEAEKFLPRAEKVILDWKNRQLEPSND